LLLSSVSRRIEAVAAKGERQRKVPVHGRRCCHSGGRAHHRKNPGVVVLLEGVVVVLHLLLVLSLSF
jgi:hypothetical protein